MRTFKTLGFLGALLAGFTILGQQADAAQAGQLARLSSDLFEEGFYQTQRPKEGYLNDGGSTSFWVWFERDGEYVVLGTCDRDCSDLDLVLKNRDGVVVDSDYGMDDTPEVGTGPGQGGLFQVTVIMASCSENPCGYSVGVFVR